MQIKVSSIYINHSFLNSLKIKIQGVTRSKISSILLKLSIITILKVNVIRNQCSLNFQFLESQMKDKNQSYQQSKFSPPKLNDHTNSEDLNYSFYKNYLKLHQISSALSQQLESFNYDIEKLERKLKRFTSQTEEFKDQMRKESPDRKKKKKRRLADEMERQFLCPVERCLRSYGAEGTLNFHIKMKHPELHEMVMSEPSSKKIATIKQNSNL